MDAKHSCLRCPGAAILTVAFAGLVFSATAQALQPADPVECRGNENVTLEGRLIDTAGVAVAARGNCTVTIRNSRLESSGTAVAVRGNAVVHIVSSQVRGDAGAINARGSAEVYYRDSLIAGAIETRAYARVIDEGGNRLDTQPATAGTPAATTGIHIGPEGVDIEQLTGQIRIGADGSVEVEDEHGHRARVGADGTVMGADAESVVTIEGDWVGIDSGDEQIDVWVEDAWREPTGSVHVFEGGELMAALGAVEHDDELQVDLSGDVLFDFDSARLRPEAAQTLGRLAELIRQRARDRVEVIGHTDSIGDDAYNLELSHQRAIAVMQWLHREDGIPAAILVGRGVGSSQPIAHNTHPDGSDYPEGRARNRRVEVRFGTE